MEKNSKIYKGIDFDLGFIPKSTHNNILSICFMNSGYDFPKIQMEFKIPTYSEDAKSDLTIKAVKISILEDIEKRIQDIISTVNREDRSNKEKTRKDIDEAILNISCYLRSILNLYSVKKYNIIIGKDKFNSDNEELIENFIKEPSKRMMHYPEEIFSETFIFFMPGDIYCYSKSYDNLPCKYKEEIMNYYKEKTELIWKITSDQLIEGLEYTKYATKKSIEEIVKDFYNRIDNYCSEQEE